ncbi:hypothetical protein Rs2_19347 [Raphanus sativus]|nr:hypothetical protein Rs2_19347 [Raphanus sativus]
MVRKAAYASWKYAKAKAIIIIAKGAVQLVASCRPSVPVFLVVSTLEHYGWSSHVASHGLVSRGIIAGSRSIGDMIGFAVQVAKKEGICNAGDSVVALRILNGYPAFLCMFSRRFSFFTEALAPICSTKLNLDLIRYLFVIF